MEEIGFYQWWQIGTGIITIVVTVAVAIVAYIQSKHEKAMQSIRENSAKLIEIQNVHSNRITDIHARLNALPEFKNMQQIMDQIHEVDKKLSETIGRLAGIIAKMQMIDQHLMNK